MLRLVRKIIIFALIISLLIPSAHGFGFGIFDFLVEEPPKTVCTPNSEIENILSDYNGTYLCKKILEFANTNSYKVISLTVEHDGCEYVYVITVTDEGQAIIDDRPEEEIEADLEVSVGYDTLCNAIKAYEENNFFVLISSCWKVKMPYPAKLNAIQFLWSF
ncbi:MAG: hypothetical protein KAH93_05685 [Candidatus Aenigmarchaeota archaeon]|nr:hypothetical protein [Candidatus Aenigmarchaeota archaeon]